MSHESKLQQMAMAELAQRCAQETDLYFHQKEHDPSYCFELFRRAIQEGSQSAWDTICVQYQPLVSGWVRQHPGFQDSGEEIQYFVNGAFAKIFSTITPLRFGGFSDIGPLLRYLKLCVHSVIVDYNRSAEQINPYPLEEAMNNASTEPAVEHQQADRAEQEALWEWINAWLQDEKERLVVYGSFALALKPQEIYDLFRDRFTDVDEVYRIKQNVISRLRRDPDFRKRFGGDDGI
jgi:hypothetical protein